MKAQHELWFWGGAWQRSDYLQFEAVKTKDNKQLC
jgi:hypothetical protein